MNVVVVQGNLSSTARERELPSGARLLQWEVTTEGPSGVQSVPVVWFDPPARVLGLEAGARVLVLGSVRRRFYRAGAATASRTEVVAERAVPGTGRTSRRRLLAAAARRLEADDT